MMISGDIMGDDRNDHYIKMTTTGYFADGIEPELFEVSLRVYDKMMDVLKREAVRL